MPSKAVVIRHHHPEPSEQGRRALAAAKDAVMRQALEGDRQEASPRVVVHIEQNPVGAKHQQAHIAEIIRQYRAQQAEARATKPA